MLYSSDGQQIALGDAAKQVSTFGGAAATAVPGVLVGMHTIAATSLAVPIIGAAIAGVTLAITALLSRKGPKQKVYTTSIVNEAEPLLQQNLSAFMASPKTQADKDAAVANFNDLWDRVVLSCNTPELGEPGQRCINDRKRGSTKGYDWFALYLDPIVNTPVQAASKMSVQGLTESLNQTADNLLSGNFDISKLLLPIIVLGGLYFVSEEF